jgi:hypothetical protein
MHPGISCMLPGIGMVTLAHRVGYPLGPNRAHHALETRRSLVRVDGVGFSESSGSNMSKTVPVLVLLYSE